MWWFWSRLFLQEIVVVTRRFLFKLSAHVLHTVPILLPAACQRLTAIAPHNMTSYLKGVFGGQEDDRFTDLGDSGDARHWDVLDGSIPQGVDLRFGHACTSVEVGFDEGWRHSVNSNAHRCCLHRNRLCEHLEPGLAHAVADKSRFRPATLVTADVDYASS